LVTIRPETASDIEAIRAVTDAAFGGRTESRLIELIRASEHFVPELSLVAEVDGEVVGHVMLSRVLLAGEADRTVLSLAPISVHPDHQNRGIGGALIGAAAEAATALGEDIVVLEGHPGYYPRFGFERAVDLGIDKPSPLVPDDAFMVLFLDEAARGTTGKLEYPPAFAQAGAVGP
jgi:putative acetyltransferase